ncbi:MAG: hypothetical protein MI739_03345 [Bacteroidales bacterium]|nr:hypothetical protein [Bacteroidales bacterium]
MNKFLFCFVFCFYGVYCSFAFNKKEQLNDKDKVFTLETKANDRFSTDDNFYRNKFFIGVGVISNSFQDTKYSHVQYRGPGAGYIVGLSREGSKYFWESAITFFHGRESAKTHLASSRIFRTGFYFTYMYLIYDRLKLGGKLELLDFYYRSDEDLTNNATYTYGSNNLYISTSYDRLLNDEWSIKGIVDLGVLAFGKESASFGYSVPQHIIEEGDFAYENNYDDPFAWKYNRWSSFNKGFKLHLSTFFLYRKRFSFGYQWKLDYFVNVKSYPVTISNHNLVVRFNIINRKK